MTNTQQTREQEAMNILRGDVFTQEELFLVEYLKNTSKTVGKHQRRHKLPKFSYEFEGD